jgi:uncharacterized protein YprB with RNaseH-like and TPR domain
MIKVTNRLSAPPKALPQYLADANKSLYFDIETTGLSPRNSFIYMIGAAFRNDPGNDYTCVQWLAESITDEAEVIEEFLELASGYDTLIHYNGTAFDIPFIAKRAELYDINFDPASMQSIDIYKRVIKYRNILCFNDYKQKTVENRMKYPRKDTLSGKELIDIYKEFSDSKDEEFKKLLFLHNHDDIEGMLSITPILSLCSMLRNHEYVLDSVNIHEHKSLNDSTSHELMIKGTFSNMTHVSSTSNITHGSSEDNTFFSFNENRILFKIPIFIGELKTYYKDYKNYYYYPTEDMAVHKSVAIYTDSDYREKASPENCYTRFAGAFIPLWKDCFTPVFRADYQSEDLYLTLTDEMMNDKTALKDYCDHIIDTIITRRHT